MLGGDDDVVGGDSGWVEALETEDVACGPGIGEDAGVGDAEPLGVIGEEGGGGVLQAEDRGTPGLQ